MDKILKLNDVNYINNIYWGEINGPTYVYLEITRHCNCNCEFCQVNGNQNIDMDINLFENIVEQLINMHTFELRIGGGEPLLHPHLEKILKIAQNMSVWICTNGILLNEKMCKMLKKNNVVGVRVSLDSLNSNLHNGIRKNLNAFQSAIKNMEIAQKNGLEVCVSMTIGTHNINEIEDLKNFALSKGYHFLTHFIMPTGKGKKFLRNNSLSTSNKIKILDEYTGEKNCVAGNQSFAIDIQGNVSACTFLKPVGNLKLHTLKQILNCKEFCKYKHCVPNSENCKNCNLNITMKDNKCIANEVCKGGCWALYENN